MTIQDQNTSISKPDSPTSYIRDKITLQQVDKSPLLQFKPTIINPVVHKLQGYGLYGHGSGPNTMPSGQKSYSCSGANIYKK